MPNNVNFQIPFLGGGPSIAEQILQGLHQGATEREEQQRTGLERQRVQNESTRNEALNRLTQTQIEHESLANAYEKETDPIKKQQILTDLHDATLKLGLAKHQAAYFGIDADALINGAKAEAEPKKTGTSTEPATPSPFDQQIGKTRSLLGTLSPDEAAIFDNGAELAKRTMNAAPVTDSVKQITQRRAEMARTEAETTPYKAWQAVFVKEHNRQPNAKEIQDFQTAGAKLRIEGMGDFKQENYLDTSQPGGQIVAMTAKEFADANKADPERFVKDSAQAQNSIKASTLIGDIRDGMTQMQKANAALPDKGLSTKARALLELAAKHPENATQTVMSGLAAEHLSEAEQDYLIAHATLAERAMAMRGLQGQGAGSDSQRAAIVAMLPGFATADKKMAEKQLKTLANNVDNVERGIPKVGKMSRQSAGEAAGGEGPTSKDLLKKYPPPKTE